MTWDNEQQFEADWWGDCANTLGEQFKHPTYARLMGMQFINDGGRYLIAKPGLSILDIGGGPVSMLLNTRGATRRTVVDPCPYPVWTKTRYEDAGVELVRGPAEEFASDHLYDEAWCYNVLQHVQDPQQVINIMRRQARVVRLFEWVDIPIHPGHPHELKSTKLAEWGGFDKGWWAQSLVVWDHWVGGPYNDHAAFHGYVGEL